MRIIADYHLHSKYSRACSKNLTLSNINAWARAKGIDLLATSDFTHPLWREQIGKLLEPAEEGLFRLKDAYQEEDGIGSYEAAPIPVNGRETRFILGTEVSCIYKRDGATRKVHLLLFVSTLKAVDKLIARMKADGRNLRADGRPILGMDVRDITAMVFDADPEGMVIPAHAWTPWFSVFGARSGFTSLEECFGELTPYIHAIETGLSSDPKMNWRVSALDNVMLISNSDAHGLRNLAREANVFDIDAMGYQSLMDILRKRQAEKFPYTIEFYPEEGKYHTDGHRACGFSCGPAQSIKLGGVCPVCRLSLTKGVLGRIDDLADRSSKEGSQHLPPKSKYIIPLEEIIGAALGRGRASKSVKATYADMVSALGPEFDILLDTDIHDIESIAGSRIAEAVNRVRLGDVRVTSGYDGKFGSVQIFEEGP